jgi:hypothetical protein
MTWARWWRWQQYTSRFVMIYPCYFITYICHFVWLWIQFNTTKWRPMFFWKLFLLKWKLAKYRITNVRLFISPFYSLLDTYQLSLSRCHWPRGNVVPCGASTDRRYIFLSTSFSVSKNHVAISSANLRQLHTGKKTMLENSRDYPLHQKTALYPATCFYRLNYLFSSVNEIAAFTLPSTAEWIQQRYSNIQNRQVGIVAPKER